jgi:hypothetical protein
MRFLIGNPDLISQGVILVAILTRIEDFMKVNRNIAFFKAQSDL